MAGAFRLVGWGVSDAGRLVREAPVASRALLMVSAIEPLRRPAGVVREFTIKGLFTEAPAGVAYGV